MKNSKRKYAKILIISLRKWSNSSFSTFFTLSIMLILPPLILIISIMIIIGNNTYCDGLNDMKNRGMLFSSSENNFF